MEDACGTDSLPGIRHSCYLQIKSLFAFRPPQPNADIEALLAEAMSVGLTVIAIAKTDFRIGNDFGLVLLGGKWLKGCDCEALSWSPMRRMPRWKN